MEFKGTKELKILHSNELGFSLGDNEHNTRITFWGADGETKANILLMLRAHEMLETINELLKELRYHGFNNSSAIWNAEQLIKESTEIN